MENVTAVVCLNFIAKVLLLSAGECYQNWQWLKTWGQIWGLIVSIGSASSTEPIIERVY